MSAEPISVRIARLRGCEPKHFQEGPGVGVIGPFWQCPDGEHETPGAYFGQIDYLAPAASFALLAEMVDAEDDPRICCDLAAHHEEPHQRYWVEWLDNRVETFASPTLGEAIALAYEAWKAARQ